MGVDRFCTCPFRPSNPFDHEKGCPLHPVAEGNPGSWVSARFDHARFLLNPGEQVSPGDVICMDTWTGLFRKADPGEPNAFVVPPDAWQDGDQLVIPEISKRSAGVRH